MKVIEMTKAKELEADQAQLFCQLGWYVSESWHTTKSVDELFHMIVDKPDAIQLAELRYMRLKANQASASLDLLVASIDKILEAAGE